MFEWNLRMNIGTKVGEISGRIEREMKIVGKEWVGLMREWRKFLFFSSHLVASRLSMKISKFGIYFRTKH